MITKEIKYDDAVVNGFLALFLNLIVLPLLVVVSFMLFKGSIIMFFLLLLFLALAVLMIPGYFSQEPNEARVMVFFGKYKGTFTETGFFWVNPFMNKKKLSLRARNLLRRLRDLNNVLHHARLSRGSPVCGGGRFSHG